MTARRAAQYGWAPDDREALLERAHRHVQRAIDLAPRDPDAHYTLALVTLMRREPVRSEAALRHCLLLSPSYAPAHGLLGLVRSHLGFPEEAEDHVGRAFALSPHEPLRAIWYWVLVNAALELDDSTAALVHAQRGMAVNTEFATLYVAAAVAAWRLGDQALASAYVRHLVDATAFSSIAAARDRLAATDSRGYGTRLVADLAAAGLPE